MNRPEQQLQKAVIQFLKVAAPEGLFYTAINPVPGKSPAVAGLSKALGMRAGVADLLFIYEGTPFFVELKAEKGRETPAQRETSKAVANAAAVTYLCRSVEELCVILKECQGVPLKARAA